MSDVYADYYHIDNQIKIVTAKLKNSNIEKSREVSIAITKLEESIMWLNRSLELFHEKES